VPIVYQLLKSVGHSTMALTEIVTPYLDNPDNQSLARRDVRLSRAHEDRTRRPRRHSHAGGLAGQ
jgi:hypothetical protein